MTEKVTESIKFLMSEFKRLLKKQKDGTISQSEIETLKSLKKFPGKELMSFSVIDHYEGFEKNNFIKRDENQINLLHKLSLSWDQYNQNNLFFFKKKKTWCLYSWNSWFRKNIYSKLIFSVY